MTKKGDVVTVIDTSGRELEKVSIVAFDNLRSLVKVLDSRSNIFYISRKFLKEFNNNF